MNINDNFRFLCMGLPDDIRRKKECGDFDGAVRLIDKKLAGGKLPEALCRSLTVQREILLRLPQDYPYSRAAAIAQIQSKIADFTEAEFNSLVEEGRIDWIYVQGQQHFFSRFFASLCKTDRVFAARAGEPWDEGTISPREVAANFVKEKGEVSARVRCRAELHIKEEAFVKGEKVRVCLPLPVACDSQSDICIEYANPKPSCITPENAPQRVIYWEQTMQENTPFTVEFSYTRTAKYHDLENPATTSERPNFDTEEVAPHIMFTPYLRALTAELTDGVEQPLEKARKIYDYITENVTYAFQPAYFGIENIAEGCARNLRGDCGVMALLFITLCRCAGVPARWESGWYVEPGSSGAHDWAQFYAAPYGWLYADTSFGTGAVRAGNEPLRRFYFGNLEYYRMAANTEFQADFAVPKDHWRVDPYDNQLGEIEFAERGLRGEEFECKKEILSLELL